MRQYLEIMKDILETGDIKHSRTGVDTIWTYGKMIKIDMSDGHFPLLTTKKMGCRMIFAELDMFIHGITSKNFLKERGCHIWDEWCNPEKVPYGHDAETRKRMAEEDDLGPIYGSQWTDWNGSGINQLRNAIDTLKKNPTDRRLVVSAWNPEQLDRMALPPCHYCFHLDSDGERVSLGWNQRSCDWPIGVPFDMASYAMLLLLICAETGLKPGWLVGFMGDCHIYVNQVEQVREQLAREPRELPVVKVTNVFDGWKIEDWKYTDFEIEGYDPHPAIKMPVAI